MKPPRSFEQPHLDEPSHWTWPWERTPEDSQPKKVKDPESPHLNAEEQTVKSQEKVREDKKQAQEQKGKENVRALNEDKEHAQEELRRRQRHTELVERSIVYKKQFETQPIPRDPTVLARLMIADHVLALNDQREQPNKTKEALDHSQVLVALDYMGDLSDKFDNPETEASPEIEETYKNVLFLAKAALEEEGDIETILATNKKIAVQMSRAEQEEWMQETEQALEKYPQDRPILTPLLAATVLIHSIMALHQQKPLTHSRPTDTPTVNLLGTGGRDVTPHSIPVAARSSLYHSAVRTLTHTTSPISSPIHYSEKLGNARFAAPIFRQASTSLGLRHTINSERTLRQEASSHYIAPYASPERTAIRTNLQPPYAAVGAIALGAYLVAANSPDRHPATTHEAQPALAHSVSDHTRYHVAPSTTAEVFHGQTSSPSIETHTTSSRKLEFMPLNSLLAMAETVPIGHGHYLRGAFEKGQIDKEGLVKILKSRARGNDFTMEYHRQVAHYKQLRSSPEFLRSATSATATPPDEQEIASASKAPETPTQPTTDRPSTISEPSISTPNTPHPTALPTSPQPWPTPYSPSFWLIAIPLIGLGIIAVIIILNL